MSHIHLPDGILPVWLWLSGYIAVGLYITYFSIFDRKKLMSKKYALVGIFAALMLITMSIEIIPPVYHLNLAILTGIVLGPELSVITILVVNIILALLGHGGVTVIGLNTFVVSLEAILGYWGFRLLYAKTAKIIASAILAGFAALFISTCVAIGIIYSGTNDLSSFIGHHDHHSHIEKIEQNHEHDEDDFDEEEFDIDKFILLVMSFSIIGWTIESVVTAFIVNYINKVRPDIIEPIALKEE